MSQPSPIRVSILLVLLITWGIWTFAIGDTIFNRRDTTLGWVTASARNYSYYSYNEIGLSVVRNRQEVDDIEALDIYSNHPPLTSWIPALAIRLMGNNELALKFGFIAALLIGSCAFYTLVRDLHNESIAFWALILFAMSPMIAFFEVTFTHDPLGFCAALLYSLFFYRWLKKATTMLFIGLIFTAILAVWTAWPAVFFVGAIGIYGMIFGNSTHRFGVVILGIITIIAFVVMMLLYELWWQGSISTIISAFIWRTSSASTFADTEPFTLAEWVSTTLYHIAYYTTFTTLILAVIGVPYMWQQSSKLAFGFTVVLFASGLLYILVLRNASFNHVYYKAFLVPGMAISAAYGILNFRKAKPRITRPFVDGLILAFIVQSIFVLYISYQTPNRTAVEELTAYLSEETDITDPIYVLFPDSAFRSYMAIEYYANVNLIWNHLLEEIPQSDEPFTYILCFEDQSYIEFIYGEEQSSTEINDLCHLYELDGTPTINNIES